MKRVLAGIAASLLLITEVTLMWRGSAHEPAIPLPPAPRFAAAAIAATPATLAPIIPGLVRRGAGSRWPTWRGAGWRLSCPWTSARSRFRARFAR